MATSCGIAWADPGGGLGELQPSLHKELLRLYRSCLDHAVTIRAVFYVLRHRKQSDAVRLSLVTLTTAAAKIGQNFIWQKCTQLFWDWDPNHAHDSVQGTSVHAQVYFIDNPCYHNMLEPPLD